MANDIEVLIEHLPSGNAVIDFNQTVDNLYNVGNNISDPWLVQTPSAGGNKPFILGVSKLGTVEQGGDGHYLWGEQNEWIGGVQVGGKYSGFWGSQISDSQGNFNPPISFTIIGDSIKRFVIQFDRILKEWASVINVDGVDYSNNAAMFMWEGEPPTYHATIELEEDTQTGYVRNDITITLDKPANSELKFGYSLVRRISLSQTTIFTYTITFAAGQQTANSVAVAPLTSTVVDYYFTFNRRKEMHLTSLPVQIKKWNISSRQAKITGIFVGLVKQYDRRLFQQAAQHWGPLLAD